MEAAENKEIMLKNIPPAMAAAYKKRFPNFWHIHEGIRVHSGKGYDAEEVSFPTLNEEFDIWIDHFRLALKKLEKSQWWFLWISQFSKFSEF